MNREAYIIRAPPFVSFPEMQEYHQVYPLPPTAPVEPIPLIDRREVTTVSEAVPIEAIPVNELHDIIETTIIIPQNAEYADVASEEEVYNNARILMIIGLKEYHREKERERNEQRRRLEEAYNNARVLMITGLKKYHREKERERNEHQRKLEVILNNHKILTRKEIEKHNRIMRQKKRAKHEEKYNRRIRMNHLGRIICKDIIYYRRDIYEDYEVKYQIYSNIVEKLENKLEEANKNNNDTDLINELQQKIEIESANLINMELKFQKIFLDISNAIKGLRKLREKKTLYIENHKKYFEHYYRYYEELKN